MGGTRVGHHAGSVELGAGVKSPPSTPEPEVGPDYLVGEQPRVGSVPFQVSTGADRTCYKGTPIAASEGCLNLGKHFLVGGLLLLCQQQYEVACYFCDARGLPQLLETSSSPS